MVRVSFSLLLMALVLFGCGSGSQATSSGFSAANSEVVVAEPSAVAPPMVVLDGQYVFGVTGTLRLGTALEDTVFVYLTDSRGEEGYGYITPSTHLEVLGRGAVANPTTFLKGYEGKPVTLMGRGTYAEYATDGELWRQFHYLHKIVEAQMFTRE